MLEKIKKNIGIKQIQGRTDLYLVQKGSPFDFCNLDMYGMTPLTPCTYDYVNFKLIINAKRIQFFKTYNFVLSLDLFPEEDSPESRIPIPHGFLVKDMTIEDKKKVEFFYGTKKSKISFFQVARIER